MPVAVQHRQAAVLGSTSCDQCVGERNAVVGVYREFVPKTGLSRDGGPGVERAVRAAVA